MSSGDLTVRVEKRDDWRLDVLHRDKWITGSALGGSGYATEEESGRTYVFERLDLGVGDLVYGLGSSRLRVSGGRVYFRASRKSEVRTCRDGLGARDPWGVNRRPKLTPDRRSKLTRCC